MMTARSTGQFSAESSLVFRQPQSYSSDEYSHSREGTAFYYLHLNRSKKAPKIPVGAAAAQRSSVRRVPHRHLSCPTGCAPGPATPLRALLGPWMSARAAPRASCALHIPARPAALPSRARPQEGCRKWPQKPGGRWRTRLPGAGALPTEEHTGLKPRPSRRTSLPCHRPISAGGGGARAAAAGGGT